MSCDQGHQKISLGAMVLAWVVQLWIFLMSCDQGHQKSSLGAMVLAWVVQLWILSDEL